MALVVGGVARYAVNQRLEGRDVVNIIDMEVDTTATTVPRDEAVYNVAGIIANQWAGDILPRQVDDLTLESISWVDLNSLDGSTGSRVATDTVTLPLSGSADGEPLPANTAALVTKQTISSRGRRNGRMFIGGLPESDSDATNGNRFDPAALAATQTALDQFLDNINQESSVPIPEYTAHMVVVHVTERDTEGNPVLGVWSKVEDLVLDGLLATQRRRLRG